MSAQGARDEPHLNELFEDSGYIAQEKLDGLRAIIHITKDGLRIFSRSAGVTDPSRPIEKTSALPHLAELRFPELVGTILDSEILIPGTDSAVLSGTVHRKQDDEAKRKVRIFVFDILKHCDVNLIGRRYGDRLTWLERLEDSLTSEYISVLPVAYGRTAKYSLYNTVLRRGGEGIVLKRLDAFYIPASRPSNTWYKAKKSATFDCVIMGFTKGAGKYNNRIGAVKFGQFLNGKLTELGQASGMTDKERIQMSTSPGYYIGKVVTIKGMERLKSGAIRHPQFDRIRFDKNPQDCIYYRSEQ